MLLKSLELQGFKTFPEKTVLKFNKGLTTVVGPNGSGKSNISDAIRWVLGEQSTKALRCSKMEDVIFNGTPYKKPKGFAQVTLNIDNKDRKLAFEDDEVSITRRYYRSGESEYLINHEVVRMKDIHELFMDTGLGKDGYSIISQGKIDDIVASKSEDRREIFEEAAGISKYRYRKTEAERKLERANENLIRITDILSELEKQVGPLFEQSEKAKKYLALFEEFKKLQIGLWLYDLEKSNDLIEKEENNLRIFQNQYDEVESQINNIIKDTEDISKSINEHTSKLDELRRDISTSDNLSTKENGEISVLDNDILHNNDRIVRVKTEIEEINGSFKNTDETLEKYASENEKLQKCILEIESELEVSKEKQANVLEKEESLKSELEKIEKEEKALTEELNQCKIDKISSKASIREQTERQEKILKTENECKIKEEELNEQFSKIQNNIEKFNADFENFSKKVNDKENYINKLKKDIDEKKNEISSIRLSSEEFRRRAELLENMENNLEGFSLSVKFIMSETKKGKTSGVYGPVSKLISVPKEYSVAIETAAISYMQNIIVKTQEDAKKLIKLLKEKKIGRATFLPVSTIKGKELTESEFKKYDGFIGVASSLCECKTEFREILKYILGRILVVDNIDNATKLANSVFLKYKIVTLDGQVINAGGSLTGGAKVKNAGVLNREKDIIENRNKEKFFNEKLIQENENLKKLFLKLNESNEEFSKLKSLLEERKKSQVDLTLELNRVKFSLTTIQNNLKNIENEKINFDENIKELNLKNQKAGENEEEINLKLESKLIEKQKLNDEINKMNLQKEEVNKELYNINLKLFSQKKDKESIESKIENIENQKSENVKKIETLKSEIEVLEVKNKEIEIEIQNKKENIITLKENAKKSEIDIEKLTKERLDLEQKITNFRNTEREKTSEKEKLSLEISKLQDKKENLQNNYDAIISSLWDEYELTRREAKSAFSIVENTSKSSKNLNDLKIKIRALGTVNVAAVEEYKEVSGRYEFLKSQVEDIEKSKKELIKLIFNLTSQMKDLFSERFKEINRNFNIVFKELFGGGQAELKITEPEDILNSGIDIIVNPPGKIVTNLELLSGGEKAFVSIALYFAIMKVNPSPFCVLDEIEAALDEGNVNRFASYLRKICDKTQFIAISHRRGTMEEADVLYGVTMQNEGISKLLELNISQIDEKFLKE